MKNWQKLKVSRVFLLLLVTHLLSCTFTKVPTQIYSHPAWKGEDEDHYLKKVVLVSTHFFQGNLNPKKEEFPDQFVKLHGDDKRFKFPKLEVGGAAVLSSYLRIFQKRYPKQSILLDTGNIFDHFDDSNSEKTLRFYEKIKFDGVLYTHRDLTTYLKNTKNNEASFKVPFLNSNIIDLKTGEPFADQNHAPYKLIKVSGLKVGIIAVTSLETLNSEKRKNLSGVYFEDPILSFLKAKKALARKGAQLIFLMAHLNSHCKAPYPKESKTFASRANYQLSCGGKSDELMTLIRRLPPHSVDAIVLSKGTLGSGYIGDLPVIQGPGKGQYISRVDFYYDIGEAKLIREKTLVHPPVKVCHSFFLPTQDCYLGDRNSPVKINRWDMLKESSFQVMPAKFLGHEVSAQPDIQSLL
ncbi:MAG: hypothetical protein HN509_14015 [Halobacteriovoraceae bacterium]|jgi:2',3'-cyclic-nucleotide 2'-phosphodiesterase (5'-nucleotidase family)|nr:hypothetical protein [Halobacteriovoraceae bacterium]MBT5093864.1 hypothetical protein [Halobacteriovoraceae bacterium]